MSSPVRRSDPRAEGSRDRDADHVDRSDTPGVSVPGRNLSSELLPRPGALRPFARALIDLALATIVEEREEEKAA
jgi:hypothetical protein